MKRPVDMDFHDYKVLRKHRDKRVKDYLKGNVVWNKGTYVKDEELVKMVLFPNRYKQEGRV